jgi:hypothetical protein
MGYAGSGQKNRVLVNAKFRQMRRCYHRFGTNEKSASGVQGEEALTRSYEMVDLLLSSVCTLALDIRQVE